jgi:NAD(P)-dependent dehydrogenase (short-subunit alcohol dehydrogenase family)
VRTDLTTAEDGQALVGAAIEAFGRVDVLVSDAGVGTAVPATRGTPEQFRSVIELNSTTCYWMAQATGRVMPVRGGYAMLGLPEDRQGTRACRT